MKSTTKLFETPRGTKEAEKAAAREKLFLEAYGELQGVWYLKLVDSGMDANQVYDKHGRHDEASAYDEAQEHYYARVQRFEHVAEESDFETKNEPDTSKNRRIWHLYAIGQTEREIADATDLHRKSVFDKLEALKLRYKKAAEEGKLLATNDSKEEIVNWNRLQAIGRKHMALIKSGKLGETIVDSVTDSGVLIQLELHNDIVEAFNNVTATLALALGGAK